MKTTLPLAMTFLTLCVLSVGVRAQSITVVVENVAVAEGKLMLQIMQGESEFAGTRDPIAAVMARAQAGEMRFSLGALPAGDYAVRVMHDRNGNEELDTNFVGMPTEPWAFSNNATGRFGPPTWEDVRFSLQADTVQSIRLNQ
jgi:uncharacterized protein (DUF2141 family)